MKHNGDIMCCCFFPFVLKCDLSLFRILPRRWPIIAFPAWILTWTPSLANLRWVLWIIWTSPALYSRINVFFSQPLAKICSTAWFLFRHAQNYFLSFPNFLNLFNFMYPAAVATCWLHFYSTLSTRRKKSQMKRKSKLQEKSSILT